MPKQTEIYSKTIKVYPNTQFPDESDLEDYSLTVIIIDENNITGLAFYHFEDKEWHFLTDSFSEDFKWYYPPITKV